MSKYKSNKDSLRFGNLKVKNEENLRLNPNTNNRFSNRRENGRPNKSILNPRV